MLSFSKIWYPPSLKKGYGDHSKLQHGISKPVFHSLSAVAPETQPMSKLELLLQSPTSSSHYLLSQRALRSSSTCIWLPEMTISTVSIFDKFSLVFSTYWIDIGSIQNKYQIDLLFILETKRIDPICISDRTWYDTYWIHLGEEQ